MILIAGLVFVTYPQTMLAAEYAIIKDGKLTEHGGIVGRSTRAGDGKDDKAFILNGLYKFVYAGAGFRNTSNARIHARMSTNKLGNTGAGLYINGHWFTFDLKPGIKFGAEFQFSDQQKKIFSANEGRIKPGSHSMLISISRMGC
jgi:hypothetical protein